MDYTRDREGFRFLFSGMKTSARPDSLPPGKYPLAVNIRAYSDGHVQSRPGLAQLFQSTPAATGYPFLDMRAYSVLSTTIARILAYDDNSRVWLDNGVQVGTLTGGTAPFGAAMIPFRPNASPNPWMYVANGSDYQKFSQPSTLNVVTAQKVGIAEPQSSPDAGMSFYNIGVIWENTALTHAGTAGVNANSLTSRVNDTVVSVFLHPGTTAEWSLQVASSVAYQKAQIIGISGGGGGAFVIDDVFTPLPTNTTISGIRYFVGTTGRCIVVPANIGGKKFNNSPQSIYTQNLLFALRRGALIKIGGEVCLVWSVSTGPDGTLSIETSTIGAHTTADLLTAVPAIQVSTGAPLAAATITDGGGSYQVTAGIGTETAAVPSNPFNLAGVSFQPDDYISFGLNVDNLTNMTEMKILLDVGDGSFTQNFYYYVVRPSDVQAGIANVVTQLGIAQTVAQRSQIDQEIDAINEQAGGLGISSGTQLTPGSSQWSQIVIPISALTRVGNDQTRTLQNIGNIQFLWNAAGTINVITGWVQVFGGFSPDVGDAGAPYQYRVRPRSSLTGVVGNPSPATRYGISPRRQQVTLSLPSAAYDSQIDTWDIFRYGGSVTSWRFIGYTPSSNTTFIDNFDDAAATAGDALDFDNFEPWPTIGFPVLGTAQKVNGTAVTIFVPASTQLLTEAFNKFLPGTLVQLGGLNVYTLRSRPVSLGGNIYLLELIENAGVGANIAYLIQEPILGNQVQPYMWGPDASGTVFACGDVFRPGTISFAKNYSPDSVPDSFNQEITPPTEPLVGGETIDGLSFAASPERWWALYPQPENVAQRYSVVQQPFTRGLAAPYGHCNDGGALYWWAKDGIYHSQKGSLTDDLYNLFPHEGIPGENITYNGVTIFAPDYTRANTFRLTYSLGYLYAIYQDSTGTYRSLTLDVKRGAWCVDQYVNPVTAAYHLEQTPQANSAVTLFAPFVGPPAGSQFAIVAQQTQLVNDITAPIVVSLATNEFDGGDVRAPKQWGDFFVDLLPAAAAGVTVTPMSLGIGVNFPTVIPANATRQRLPISTGVTATSDFMGLMLQWTDDYAHQATATRVNIWQPSYIIQPARTVAWSTLGTAYGLDGYMHIRQVSLAYICTAPVVFSVASYDGQSPAPITLPSTNGNYQKTLFPLSANKGQLYKYIVFSPTNSPFQIFAEDSEIYVGGWGRGGPYLLSHKFAGGQIADSPI